MWLNGCVVVRHHVEDLTVAKDVEDLTGNSLRISHHFTALHARFTLYSHHDAKPTHLFETNWWFWFSFQRFYTRFQLSAIQTKKKYNLEKNEIMSIDAVNW